METGKEKIWDRRTLERQVRRGRLTRSDINKHVKGLPDVTAKGITLGEREDEWAAKEAELRAAEEAELDALDALDEDGDEGDAGDEGDEEPGADEQSTNGVNGSH